MNKIFRTLVFSLALLGQSLCAAEEQNPTASVQESIELAAAPKLVSDECLTINVESPADEAISTIITPDNDELINVTPELVAVDAHLPVSETNLAPSDNEATSTIIIPDNNELITSVPNEGLQSTELPVSVAIQLNPATTELIAVPESTSNLPVAKSKNKRFIGKLFAGLGVLASVAVVTVSARCFYKSCYPNNAELQRAMDLEFLHQVDNTITNMTPDTKFRPFEELVELHATRTRNVLLKRYPKSILMLSPSATVIDLARPRLQRFCQPAP